MSDKPSPSNGSARLGEMYTDAARAYYEKNPLKLVDVKAWQKVFSVSRPMVQFSQAQNPKTWTPDKA